MADFGWQGQPARLADELARAQGRVRRAVSMATAAGDEDALAWAQGQLALTMTRQALAGAAVDPTEAAVLLAQAGESFRRRGDVFGQGVTGAIGASGALAAGDLVAAAAAVRTTKALVQANGDRFIGGRIEWMEGVLAEARGDLDGAYQHIDRGLCLLDELGMRGEVTAQAALLESLAERRGEHALAAQWRVFVSGRNGGLARHDWLLRASARNAEGHAARARGGYERARRAHEEAVALFTDAQAWDAVAQTRTALDGLATGVGDPDAGAAARSVS